MAILHRKEEKIQAVLGRLPKNYTDEDFVSMFIKLYSKDWGKIKAAYIKQAQDKEPGTVINMPKPDLYLKQLAEIYIKANPPKAEVIKEEVKTVAAPAEKVKKVVAKKVAVTKEKADVVELPVEKIKKTTVKKDTVVKATVAEPKVTKATAKKKIEVIETPVEVVKKAKVVTKKKEATAETAPVKKKAVTKK